MNPRPYMDHNIVTVTDIAMPGNAGVAKIDNFVVFIPGAVPGDRVAVRIVKREKRFGYGELDRYRRGVSLSGQSPLPPFRSLRRLHHAVNTVRKTARDQGVIPQAMFKEDRGIRYT